MLQPGPLAYTYTQVTVGAASTELVAANSKRMYLMIINRSTERIDLKEGAAAVSGEGTPLNPVDASSNIMGWHEWSQHLGNLTQEAVNGICASGGKTVTVKEGV